MKTKLCAIALGMVAISTLLFGSAVGASSFRAADNTTVGKDEVVDSSLYAAGSTITIQGTVKGDVYCAGQIVEITGVVEGDVMCASQTMRIDGTVFGDVRVAAQTVSIGASVGQSVTAFAQDVNLTESANVQSDATIFASSIRILGQVGRDIVAGAENINVLGVIGRDAELDGKQVTLAANSRIDGNLVYISNNQASIDPTAVVVGSTTKKAPEKRQTEVSPMVAVPFGATVAGAFYGFLVILVIGLIALWVVPSIFEKASDNLQKQPLQMFGFGILALVAIPVVMLLLVITLIGIPVALMLGAAWFIWAMISHAIASLAFGSWISRKLNWNSGNQKVIAFVVGLAVISIVSIVPLVGGLVSLVVWLCGFGTIVATAWRWRFGGDVKAVKSAKA